MPDNDDIAVYELTEDTQFVTTYDITSLDTCTSVAYSYEDIVTHHVGSMGDIVSMYDIDRNNVPEVLVRNSHRRIRIVRLKSWISHIIAATRDGAKITNQHDGVRSCVHSNVEKYLNEMGVKYDDVTGTFSKYKPRAKSDQSDTEFLAKIRRYVPIAVAVLMGNKFGVQLNFIHIKTIDKIANVAKLAQSNGLSVDEVVKQLENEISWYKDTITPQTYIDTFSRFRVWYNKVVA